MKLISARRDLVICGKKWFKFKALLACQLYLKWTVLNVKHNKLMERSLIMQVLHQDRMEIHRADLVVLVKLGRQVLPANLERMEDLVLPEDPEILDLQAEMAFYFQDLLQSLHAKNVRRGQQDRLVRPDLKVSLDQSANRVCQEEMEHRDYKELQDHKALKALPDCQAIKEFPVNLGRS